MNIQGVEVTDEDAMEIVQDGKVAMLYFHTIKMDNLTEEQDGHIFSMMGYLAFLEAVIEEVRQNKKIKDLMKS